MSYNLPNQIIDASGNKIGIGTTAPEYRLDVRSSGVRSQVFGVQGDQGRLLSIEDNLSSGTLFSVSNITGLPSFEVNASGDVDIAEFGNSITTHKPITITNYTPVSTNNKLYNDNGILKWNGSTIVAGFGTSSGVVFYDANGALSDDPKFRFESINDVLIFGDGSTASQSGISIETTGGTHEIFVESNILKLDSYNRIKMYGGGVEVFDSKSSPGIDIANGVPHFNRGATFYPLSSNYKGVLIKAKSGQSANLTEWQTSAGDVLTSIDNDGNVDISGTLRCNDIGITTGSLSINAGGGSFAFFKFNNTLEYAMTAAEFRPNNLAKNLGATGNRWDNFYVKNINASGTTTFLKDDGSATDIFYSGNSLVMELPNKNFKIRGVDGNDYIDFQDAGNGAINVRTNLYPNGNKQTRLGFSTLRWEVFYGGRIDIETHSVAVPTAQIRAINSQTADLTQWQDSSSNVLAYVDKDGHAHFPSLSVSGDFTYVNSENVTIFDKQIELASLSGSAVSGDALVDEGGFVLKSTDGDKQFIWRDYDDAWTSNQNISLTSGNSIYLYNSGIGTADYERIHIGYDNTYNYHVLESQAGGSATQRKMTIRSARLENTPGYSYIRVDAGTAGNINSWRNLVPQSDDGLTLGGAGKRWSEIHGAQLFVTTDTSSDVVSTFKAASAQSANLTDWKDSSDNLLASVGPDGSISADTITLYGSGLLGSSDYEAAIFEVVPTGSTSELRIGTKSDGTGTAGGVRIYSGYTGYGQGNLQVNTFGQAGIYYGNNKYLFNGQGYLRFSTVDPTPSPSMSVGLGEPAAVWKHIYVADTHISGVLYASGDPGTADQVLTSTADGIEWRDANTLAGLSGTPSGVAFFGEGGLLTDDSGFIVDSGYGKILVGINATPSDLNSYNNTFNVFSNEYNQQAKITLKNKARGNTILDIVATSGGRSASTTYTVGDDDWHVGQLTASMAGLGSRFVVASYDLDSSRSIIMDTNGYVVLGDTGAQAKLHVNNTLLTTYPVSIFRGMAGQTANLTEWQDSAGDTLASVEPDGALYSAGTITASGQFIKFKHATNDHYDVWFGHNSPGSAARNARIYADYMLFRGGSHGISMNNSSSIGGITASAGHTIGFNSTAVTNSPAYPDAAIARTAKGHIRIIDHHSTTSENLGDLTASGVHVSGVHLLPNVPADTTDVIYNSGGQMTWDGAFAAETKSFLIDHPTRENMKLQYGSLEGPENGVYVRGSTNGVIELPDYWTGLVDEESITVQLTPKSHSQNTYVSGIMNNKVYLISDTDIDVYYNVYGTRKDVAPLEVEW